MRMPHAAEKKNHDYQRPYCDNFWRDERKLIISTKQKAAAKQQRRAAIECKFICSLVDFKADGIGV